MNAELLRKRQPAFSIAHPVAQCGSSSVSDMPNDIKDECMTAHMAALKQPSSKDKHSLPTIKEGFGYALLSSMGITEEKPLIPYEGQGVDLASATDN